MAVDLLDRFLGCLWGIALGDAMGARFEAQSPEALARRFDSVEKLVAGLDGELWYTDDTQMTIGVAETLVRQGCIQEEALCQAFVENYQPSRGYGRGARAVLEAMESGGDYQRIAEQYFPGGSYGNGAAMRVAPVGLVFHKDERRLWEEARLSALPTHQHPLGIEGAQLLALAVGLCVQMETFERGRFLAKLFNARQSEKYRQKLAAVIACKTPRDLAALGNGIEALHSVPTAIASFALAPESYERAVGNVILLGGDTDTLAAMAGALSGAYLGAKRLPANLVNQLEDTPKGKSHLEKLAGELARIADAMAKKSDFPELNI